MNFFAGACNWFAPKHLSEAERQELVSQLKGAVEKAGGAQVWIKVPGQAAFPPAKPDTPIETLATVEVYPAVVSALQRQSERSHLEFKSKETRSRKGWRTADIRLRHQGERVCRWHLREVRRLLRAAIVIDDLGQDLQAARKLLALPCPLTFSILPHRRYSAETADETHRAGREVMLHLPMEAEPGSHPGPGEGQIRSGMSGEELQWVLQVDLTSVPHAAGVNNHMGSLATAQPLLMAAMMKALAERHLYFVDSRTTPNSVALAAARRQNLPAFYRAVFLDDTETVPYTLRQLWEFRRVVQEQGAALAIGHPYPTTLVALAKFLPELERQDIQLVPASQLVRLPEVARLSPTRRAALHPKNLHQGDFPGQHR